MATTITTSRFIPERIRIVNFNNIRDLDLVIDPVLVITGKNGTGKTSIAQAIEYCLTGHVMNGVLVNDIITIGESRVLVEIDAIYNGNPVKVTRERRGKSQKLKVVTGSGDGASEITNPGEFLEGIVTQLEFEKLYYINGHAFNTFLDGTTVKTNEVLDKLFSINHANDIIKSLSQAIIDIDKKINLLKATLETLERKEQIFVRLQSSGDMVSNITVDVAATRDEIPGLKKKRESMVTLLSELESHARELQSRANAYLESKRLMESNSSNKTLLESKIAKCVARKSELKSVMDSMDISSDFGAGIDANIVEMELEMADIDKKIEFWKEFPDLISRVLKQTPGGSGCPLCLADGKRSDALENVNRMNDDRKVKLKEILVRKSTLKEAIKNKKEEKSNIETFFIASRENETSLASFQKALDEVNDTIESSEPVDADGETILASKESIMERISETRIEMAKIDAVIHVKEEFVTRREVEIESLSSSRVTMAWTTADASEMASNRLLLDSLVAKKEKLIIVKNGFKEILSMIRERIMGSINPDIMKFIRGFTRNRTKITAFEIMPLVKSAKQKTESNYYYDFKVEIDGTPLKFDALSTGQKALVLISIILNMINFSNGALSLLVIDEIDNCGLDRENIRLVLDAIVNMAASSNKVLFINRDAETIKAIIDAGKEKEMDIRVVEMHG